MARMTKAEKALDKSFDDAYRRLGSGIQVDMMDLGNIRSEAVTSAGTGTPMDDAVKAVLAKYRKN